VGPFQIAPASVHYPDESLDSLIHQHAAEVDGLGLDRQYRSRLDQRPDPNTGVAAAAGHQDFPIEAADHRSVDLQLQRLAELPLKDARVGRLCGRVELPTAGVVQPDGPLRRLRAMTEHTEVDFLFGQHQSWCGRLRPDPDTHPEGLAAAPTLVTHDYVGPVDTWAWAHGEPEEAGLPLEVDPVGLGGNRPVQFATAAVEDIDDLRG
jgi:hypothetical protein